MKKGTLTLKDLFANFSTMRFKAEATKGLSDLQTLKTALAAYTNCHIRAEGFQEKVYYGVDGAGNRDIKGIVTVADSDGEVHKWALAGYNGATEVDQEGEKMANPDLGVIVAAIAVFTGETYTVLRSPVIQTR